MLTISEWIFRMRDNAAMYSLIAISTSVAFVGISVMLAIGSSSFSSIQGISVAYVFPWSGPEDLDHSEGKMNEIKTAIEEKGYSPVTDSVSLLWAYANLDESAVMNDSFYTTNGFSIMRESDYQKMMKQIGEEADSVADNQIMTLSANYSRRKQLLEVPENERTSIYPLELGSETGIKKGYYDCPQPLNAFSESLWFVSCDR